MEEKLQDQPKSSRADHLKPWQFKKGQSGNPKGRKPGPSLKEYAKKYLATLTEEERLEYLEGLDKKTVWEMAEGKPKQDTDITSGGEKIIPIYGGLSRHNSDQKDIQAEEESQSS